jgi:hypothetical protein
LLDVYRDYFNRMQRSKQLERYRFYHAAIVKEDVA